jgi:hypothetical protein
MTDYPHVRTLLACPKCSQPKDQGLLLCWPCHRQQKREHGGGYSAQTMHAIETLEAQRS